MATYVNDLRLKEIGTGESSGTWGTETNTNLELIGEALGFGTEAITTNADTHTTTVADGSTDPGRAMYLKYTGTLDSACTITIAPNTMSRMHFIENGTSGSQNIIISQGTGANVTIPPGDTKAVYLDGAGSGAAVADAFASLNTVDLKVEDDLTVTDDVSIGGALTLTGNGDFNGDLDVDGTTNLDVVDIDGAVDMATTLTLAGNADFNGDLDVDGTTNLDAVDIDGAVQIDATLSVGVNDTGYDVKLFGDADGAFLLWDASIDDLILSGARIGIGLAAPQQSIHTHIASSGAAYHQFTNSSTGSGSGDGWLYGIDGDENFVITGQESSETFLINNNSANRFSVNHNGIVAVGTSLGTDAILNVVRSSGEIFRADANNGAFRLVANQDGVIMNGLIGIGVTSPATTLHIDASGGAVLRMQRTSASASNKLELSYDGNNATISSSEAILFNTFGTEDMRLNDGALIIGRSDLDSNSAKLDVYQNANNKFTGMFRCDGNNVNRFGPCIRAGTDDNSGTNTMLTFQDGDGDGIGTITSSGGTVTYGAFTAHHEVNVPNSDNPSDDSDAYPYGTLVEVVSVYLSEANKRQSIRYTVQKSQSANSKKVLGAYASNMRPSPMCPTTGTYANNLHNISILGDGHIICNNSGGNIEVGDGICTSSVEGIGMKATANPSMIVGIAQEAVTFSGSETKLVPVQFGVQQFTPWS